VRTRERARASRRGSPRAAHARSIRLSSSPPAHTQDLAEELLEGSLFNLIAEAVLGEFDATTLPRQIVTNLEVTASPSLERSSVTTAPAELSIMMGASEFGEEYEEEEALPSEHADGAEPGAIERDE
jgi:hypothetical protein